MRHSSAGRGVINASESRLLIDSTMMHLHIMTAIEVGVAVTVVSASISDEMLFYCNHLFIQVISGGMERSLEYWLLDCRHK